MKPVVLSPSHPRGFPPLAENALRQVLAFWDDLGHSDRRLRPYVAWISAQTSVLTPYPPAFESRGLSLDRVLFIESANPARTLGALLADDVFFAAVIDAPQSPSLLALARRWMSPPDSDKVVSAAEAERRKPDKILILMDSSKIPAHLTGRMGTPAADGPSLARSQRPPQEPNAKSRGRNQFGVRQPY